MLNQESKKEVLAKHQRHSFDTGSPEVQIAILTEDIIAMMPHAKANKKDHSFIRGLQKKVATRKRLLKYLHRKDLPKYEQLIKELGIRG